MTAGAGFPTRHTGRGAAHESHARKQAIMLGIFALVAVVVVVGVIFGVQTLRGPERAAVGDDEKARSIISNRHYEEMREWLSQGHQRNLVGHSHPQSQEFCEKVYGLGAKRVLAGGNMASTTAIIELPDSDTTARAALIGFYNDWDQRYNGGISQQTDIGQQYLILEMPLNR